MDHYCKTSVRIYWQNIYLETFLGPNFYKAGDTLSEEYPTLS